MEAEEHAEDLARGAQAVVPFHLLAEKGVCLGFIDRFLDQGLLHSLRHRGPRR